jgi:selenocysteine-specific elongation factor
MDVICTAGHVDHGKSTLVRALTGMEPDRFAEERRRGLTIDLGFAWTDMTVGDVTRTVAFVDLPGHERFIANMLAGAGPVEAALFVVAADEGWKPQSQEHLDILDVLQVSTGVVAITKADLVDAATLEATCAAVEQHLAGTSLEGAALVPVSGVTQAGLDDLRAALVNAIRHAPMPPRTGRARLWIDRAFTIKGAGTVVTGTLGGGVLRTGEDLVVSPGARPARVRGLQSLKAAVTAAEPGDRVAVNLVGIDLDEVRRGHTVAAGDGPAPAKAVDVWLRVLHDHRVTRRGAWHLHAGSGEWVADVRPLGGSAVNGEGYARILLRDAAPLEIGDRFVLREAGRRATVGGGLILDINPPREKAARGRGDRAEHLALRRAALLGHDRAALFALHVEDRQVITAEEAAAAAGLDGHAATEAARTAGMLRVGRAWVAPAAGRAWAAAVTQALQDFHAANPVDRAAPRDVALRAAIGAGCPTDLAAELLAVLVRLGRVVTEGAGVRDPSHGVRLDPAQQQARDRLLAALQATPLSPPPLEDAAASAGASAALVRELEAEGVLIRLAPGIAVTQDALESAVTTVRDLHAQKGPFTAAEAKAAWNTTRKYAVPLLELLDQRGITRRSGDTRVMV